MMRTVLRFGLVKRRREMLRYPLITRYAVGKHQRLKTQCIQIVRYEITALGKQWLAESEQTYNKEET